ncbi:MAG: enterochelin esterase-like enzyme [Firmicutes bacterium]|nr:enterochelin esterase-like enzyme [Bacillota bacterium]
MKKSTALSLAAVLLLMMFSVSAAGAVSGFKFEVKVPDDFVGELNGRCLVALTKDVSKSDPYKQVSPTGVPVFGKTVFGLKAGDVITFTADDKQVYGFPFQMDAIPQAELYVQAFFVKYTKFTRANGSTIWAMADHGGGGNMFSNPYNLYSKVVKSFIDVSTPSTVKLELTEMIQLPKPLKEGEVTQQGNYEDKPYLKYVKIQSKLLTEFWGTPMYIGANVLLPNTYGKVPGKKYPVLYYQGHWPGGAAPLSYESTSAAGKALKEFWDSADAPQMLAITIRDANPFYDTSYSVNTANIGPWGDAITKELIPYLEKTFDIIAEPWARMLAGGSTGGWESLAMQVFYPDYFGGTWSMCPDPVDFNYYQIVNIYKDDNAYYIDKGWYKVERPGSRKTDGNINYMMKDENFWEVAVGGLEAISLGQWAVWEAVYGPMAADGYPARIWDPLTGKIDKAVAEYWKQNFDLNYKLQKEWPTLGPKLVGKIHLRGGDMDAYYLNNAQYLLGDWLETTKDPYYAGYSVTFPRMGHTGNISNPDLLKEMAAHMIKYGPADAAAILAAK